MNTAYPQQAAELIALLEADQEEYKVVSRKYYWDSSEQQSQEASKAKALFREHVQARARRMLEILKEIGQPSIANIGKDAAQAVSILATHSSLSNTRKVLAAFESCYEQNQENTYYQSIPSMIDWALLLEQKPQRFGTIWLFDKNKQPYLPIVENFENVDKLRAEYDIEPLHWPKSLAIPEADQPWLKQPLSELVMRKPTASEYAEFADFV